jgi:hypothetical protein
MNFVKSLFGWLTGDQFIMYMGGGGGGSPPPTQNTSYTTNIPEYARPYVEQMLGAAQKEIFNYEKTGGDPIYNRQGKITGRTKIKETPTGIKPYQAFSDDPTAYFAGFSPMQKQAQESAQNMLAGPEGFQRDIGAYMSPYAELALQPQLQAAARQSAIQGQQQQAQATQAGAFGGGREAIMRAERERALGDTQSNIMATGMQNAFNQAQNQYNSGFGQQQGLIGLQNQLGGQQQQFQQGILNQQIQDYATKQQYPMLQLANMSALTRGLPMQSGTTQMYQAAPSAASQLGGLGLAGIGLSQLSGSGKAKGGRIKAKKRPAGLAELALSKMQ